jgi:hypothetical protein
MTRIAKIAKNHQVKKTTPLKHGGTEEADGPRHRQSRF